ncbi:hypothetical protein V8E53_013502 [Lactarius tabidus]
MCQWSVHMMERVNESNYLKLPNYLELRLVIGLFHIHRHQDTCLARYLPSFIRGGRQIDGKTIEMLWAPLNEITRSTRGMSTSHHREVIDDHMNYSNWKKLIDLGNAAAFDSINASAKPDSVLDWTAEEENAQSSAGEVSTSQSVTQRERGRDIKVMDIYDIKTRQFPSHAEILLELTDNGMGGSTHKRHTTWIGSGIKIQEMQYVNPTGDSWDGTFVRETYIGAEFDGINEGEDVNECTLPAEEHDQVQTVVNWSANASIDAEYIPLHLPSHFGFNRCSQNAAEDLAEAELRLREGQLNDSLHHIQIALGHKSFVFRHDVCSACTQRLKTRAWEEVHIVESTVQHHAWVYICRQKAMVDLGASTDLLDWYKVLKHQDLSGKTIVISPQVQEQQNKTLPWFWNGCSVGH